MKTMTFTEVPCTVNKSFNLNFISSLLLPKLFYYNTAADVLCHQSEQGFPFDVPEAKITCMYQDSRNNLWIGTYDQGYHVVYAYEENFNDDSWLKSSLANKSVVAVADDSKGNLWIKKG